MAKKFTFRLEPILNIKSYKVKEAKEALEQIIGLRIQKEIQIAEKEEYMSSLLKSKKGSIQAAELQASFFHKNVIKEEIKKLNLEKLQLVEIENLRRIKLTEVLKEEKVLEKLKEKKKEQFTEEVKSEETKTIDEIARNHHNKNELIKI